MLGKKWSSLFAKCSCSNTCLFLCVQLALDLGSEVKRQNTLLDGMSGTFDNAGDALGRSFRELKRLANSGSAGHLCALFTFAFLFILLTYLLLRP